jgi:hypothetical protein
MNRRWLLLGNLLLGGVLMLLVWALLVWVGSRPALKALVDLTPQQTNTVDPLTEELLRDLRAQQADVEFHLFAPPLDGEGADAAQQQALAIRARLVDLTRTLLVRYQYLGGERVIVRDYDFYRDSQAAREAKDAFGYKVAEAEVLVVAVRMPGKERRFRKLSLISDLAEIQLPQSSPLPQGMRVPVPLLKNFKGEEGISSALKSLLVQGVPVLYVLQGYSPGLDMTSATAVSYSGLVAALQRAGFDVLPLSLRDGGGVPKDATIVLVLEPRHEFSAVDAEALYAFAQRGGRVIVNYSWSGVPDQNPTGGRFGELVGYEVDPRIVYHMIPGGGRTGGRWLDGDDAVSRLQMAINPSHPVTRRIAESRRPLEVTLARALTLRPGSRGEPLLQTGPQAWLGVQPPDGGPPDNRAPQIQLQAFEVGYAFEVERGQTAAQDGSAAAGEAERRGQVLVLGGMFASNIGMRAGFGDFLVDACNWLAERKVLMGIKGAGYQAKMLDVKPPQLDRTWWLLVVGVPAHFLVLGAVVMFVRRRQ